MVQYFVSFAGQLHVVNSTCEVTTLEVKHCLEQRRLVPAAEARLVCGTRQLQDGDLVAGGANLDCRLRVLGGKGGFGAMLRSGPQNMHKRETSNFGACRTLDGRRVRHVDQEQKLKSWYANGEEDVEEEKAPTNKKARYAWMRRKRFEEKERLEREALVQDTRPVIITTAEIAGEGHAACRLVEEAVKKVVDGPKAALSPPRHKRKRDTTWAMTSVMSEDSDDSEDEAEPSPKRSKRRPEPVKEPVKEPAAKTKPVPAPEPAPEPDPEPEPVEPEAEVEPEVEPEVEEAKAPHVLLELQKYATAEELARVDAALIKADLMHHGLKAGGTPLQRAQRLMLTKGVDVASLPRKHFAKKKR